MTTRSTKRTRIKIKVRRGTVAAQRTRDGEWIDIKIVSPNPKKCMTLRIRPRQRLIAKRQVEDALNAGWISSAIDEFFDKVRLL